MAPASDNTKAPTTTRLSRLHRMAFGIAVYASPRRLPDAAQDSLPGAGQALLGGLPTRRAPTKGFKLTSCSPSSFPKFRLAQATFRVCWGVCPSRRQGRVDEPDPSRWSSGTIVAPESRAGNGLFPISAGQTRRTFRPTASAYQETTCGDKPMRAGGRFLVIDLRFFQVGPFRRLVFRDVFVPDWGCRPGQNRPASARNVHEGRSPATRGHDRRSLGATLGQTTAALAPIPRQHTARPSPQREKLPGPHYTTFGGKLPAKNRGRASTRTCPDEPRSPQEKGVCCEAFPSRVKMIAWSADRHVSIQGGDGTCRRSDNPRLVGRS